MGVQNVLIMKKKGWRVIKVGYYFHGFPKPKEGEILYKLNEFRGWLLTKKDEENES